MDGGAIGEAEKCRRGEEGVREKMELTKEKSRGKPNEAIRDENPS